MNFSKVFKIIFLTLAFILSPKFALALISPISGYAWSENAGWIDLAPAGGGVSIDDKGDFGGYAWGENIGWVSFNCANTASCSDTSYKASLNLVPICPVRSCQACPVCPVLDPGANVAPDGAPCASSDITAPKISAVAISDIASKSVVVSWQTDELADSLVEFGTDTSYSFISGNSADISLKTTNHRVFLANLFSDTSYHLRVISQDVSGNMKKSEDFVFKTLKASKESDDPSGFDSLQLVLMGDPEIKSLNNFSVNIIWKTDKESTSLVRIKPLDASDDKWQEVGNTGDYVYDHSVILTGLKPNAVYQYQVKSSSNSGNAMISKIKIFTTKPEPTISDVSVFDITIESATISWKTNIASTSIIEYGVSEIDNFSVSKEDFVTSHEIKLKNLKSGETYNFKVKGKDEIDNSIVSDNYIFETYAPPLVVSYKIEDIKDTTAVIIWETNTDTDSLVIYSNLETGESKTQGDTKLARVHNLKLEGLDSGTDYAVKIEGRDVLENTARGPEIKIKTLLDQIAPMIANVRTYTTIMSSKGKAQLVIVWKTDEPSNSQVLLFDAANISDPVYSSSFDPNLTTNHTVVVTDLKLDTAYRLRIKSADKTGNSGLSQDFAALTPQEKKSIIAMILENFEKIFGWVKEINS